LLEPSAGVFTMMWWNAKFRDGAANPLFFAANARLCMDARSPCPDQGFRL
jgi:hypothetical protein